MKIKNGKADNNAAQLIITIYSKIDCILFLEIESTFRKEKCMHPILFNSISYYN